MFEHFEVGAEIGWGEESVVYQATKKADASVELALKIRRVGDDAAAEQLLAAAKDQEKASRAGCRWIVNLMASGTGVGEVFHVTPRYPRSLLTLIQGKVTVNPEGMLHFTESVLASLHDLQTKIGRAHGNLKPSNVLLAGTAQLRESGVFLTDLAPAGRGLLADDLHAVGTMLFSLVRKREVEHFDWPLLLSSEWQALGAPGAEWLKFTNLLLDPALGRKTEPLALAERALAHLQKRQGGLAGFLPILQGAAIAAAVLAAVGGLGVAVWKIAHHQSVDAIIVEPTAAPDAWFGNLALELGAKPKWVSGDPYLNEKVIKPVRALDLRDGDAKRFREAALPADANARVRAAAELLPSIRKNLEAWEQRLAVQRSFTKFQQLGWAYPARSLERLGSGISNDRPVLEQFQDVEASSKLAAEIEAKWQQLQTLSNGLQNTGDPVLRGGLMFAAAEAGRGQNLYDLRARLDALGKRLQTDLQLFAGANQSRMKSEANLPEVQGEVTAPVFDEWERQVKRFQPAREEAARLGATWKARLATIEAKNARTKEADSGAWQENLRRVQRETDEALARLIVGEVDEVTTRTNAALEALDQQMTPGAAPLAMNPVIPAPTVAALATPPPKNVPQTTPPVDREPQDRQAWVRILASARSTDLGAATAEQAKTTRDNLVGAIARQTSPAFQARLGAYLTSLNALTFAETAAPASAPKLPGWDGPSPVAGGVAYRFGSFTMEFVLIPADGDKAPFYLGRFETPAGLVVDWMNARGSSGWSTLGIRTNANVSGPRVWAAQGTGIAVRTDTASPWAWPTSLTHQLPFYAAAPTPPPGPLLPMNYVSANSAAAIAASFGARLPTAEEWQRPARLQLRNLDSAPRNLRDAAWDEQRRYIAKSVTDLKTRGTDLPDPPWPDGDIFLPSNVTVARRQNAAAAVEGNDKTLWFSPVTQGEPGRLLHLIGNVAEFVADVEGAGPPRFSVIGGSALSPREVDPASPYLLNSAQRLAQYSDVGFRLALSPGGSASPARRDITALQQLLQNAPAMDAAGGR